MSRRGATLLEVLVVMCILAILAGAVAPAVSRVYRTSSARVAWLELWHTARVSRLCGDDVPDRALVSYLSTTPDSSLSNLYAGFVTYENADWDMIRTWREATKYYTKK